jgi:putative phage-type endonuclease
MGTGNQTQTLEQRSPEWFEARKGRITASIVGAILGHAPYMSRDDAMRSMVRAAVGAPSEFTGNIATEYGTRNEENALFEYRLLTGATVDLVGFVQHEDWAICDVGGLIGGQGGLEIKCPFGKRSEKHPEFLSIIDGDLPHYYDQVQFSLWVTGRKWWDFFQWSVNGNRTESVHVDQSWRDENLPRLRQFYAEYLAALDDPADYISDKRVTIDTPEASRMVAEYDELAEAIENATAKRKELLEQMVTLSGGKNAIVAGRKLTETQRKGSVSYAKALAKYAPKADLEPFRGKASSSWGLK